jgi:23S rRNA pseudouridine1911/1915/1917 synthase
VVEQVTVEIPEVLDGARLDKAVAELLGLSRAQASAVVADGVELDGHPAEASHRVRPGQIMTCRTPADSIEIVPEEMAFEVLYEDDSVIVVDKPPGIAVHPGSGRTGGTLVSGLIARYPDLVGVGSPGRWGLVHRLDKDTSGVLCVARTDLAFGSLTRQLKRREMSRVYTTLVEGRMAAPTGTIEAPITRDPSRPTRQMVAHGGRHARTHFEVVRYYDTSDVSLLTVRLETGRTHQIRVHMESIGHPVVGDWTYGATRRDPSPPRTFLHASRLEFDHPVTGDRLEIEAPLPDDLQTFLHSQS